jgi:hypothetical protein
MTALEPWKSKLIFLDGLGMLGGPFEFRDDDNEHGSGMCCAFTGGKVAGALSLSPSVDQVVAAHLASKTKTRYTSLALGVNSGAAGKHKSCFFSASQRPVNPQTNPQAAFDSIFKDVQVGAPPKPDTAGFEREKQQRQTVLAAVRADLDRVCKRIGAAEREKCEAHAHGLSMLESRLSDLAPVTGGVGCYKPVVANSTDLVATISAQTDLVAAALACDLTRVATLQLGHADGGLTILPGVDHHNTTHEVGSNSATAIANHEKIDRWMADRIAYLLGKLDGVRESNGTLLDNTLVLFGSDTTTAMQIKQGPHRHFRFPYFLAGGSNFAFKTGRHIVYGNPNTTDVTKWVAHTRLLVSIARKFGVELDQFGGWDNGTGPLAML